ncbi:copper-binding protein [Limnobacter sp.]|uniref:copper-binding protein n=1 Tax=Limnobacter sp. TaxID=2003368 RepID=UPI0035156BA1
MKKTIQLSITTLALLTGGVAFAGNHAGGHSHDHGAAGAKAADAKPASAELADAEVRKINKSTGKITLKHGEIKSVAMPPMTMVFAVEDKAMLEGLKEGDKVKFDVKQEGTNYTVTTLQKAQ